MVLDRILISPLTLPSQIGSLRADYWYFVLIHSSDIFCFCSLYTISDIVKNVLG